MRKIGLSIVFIAAQATACGGSSDGASSAASAPTPPPPPASELHTEHLPPSLAWVSIGETTPEQVRTHFTGDNLFVSDSIATRGMMAVRPLGPNNGRMAGTINVGRKTDINGPIGELGDNYGAVTFYFTPLADGQPPVLYRLEVAQLGTTGSVCQPAAVLAAGTGLSGCDPNDRIPASAPTAVEGRWCTGPGAALFDAIATALGPLQLRSVT